MARGVQELFEERDRDAQVLDGDANMFDFAHAEVFVKIGFSLDPFLVKFPGEVRIFVA
jgi:hypothetical protein